MSESTSAYRTVFGAIQFDPETREANGKPVLQATIQQVGFGPTAVRVRITFWLEDFPGLELNRYDVVLVDGKYTSNQSGGKTYHNLSATRFLNFGQMSTKSAIPTTVGEVEVSEEELSEIPF